MTKQYLLYCIAEEAGEVAQAAAKALRFGMEDEHEGKTCAERLLNEIHDLVAVYALLAPDATFDEEAIQAKQEKVLKYYTTGDRS